MTSTQTTMDHHIRSLNSALGALLTSNDDTTPSTYSNSPVATPTDQIQHSRNSSRASTVSSSANQNVTVPSTERPRSRTSQASGRGKLPDAADPEYSYVYVPPLSSLPTTSNAI